MVRKIDGKFWRYFTLVSLAAFSALVIAGYGCGGAAAPIVPPDLDVVPVAPLSIVATAGDAQVTITWDVVEGATQYNLYIGVSGSGELIAANVTSPYVDAGLVNGTAYVYQLTAENVVGESERSVEVSATPTAASGGGGVVDTTAPTVSMTTPVNGAIDIDVDLAGISVTFNEEMDVSTYPAGGASFITVTGPEGAIAGTFTSTNTSGTFSPTTRLANNTTYTVTVTAGTLTDVAGNGLNTVALTWTFTTAHGWSNPLPIDSSEEEVSAPDIAMDAAGNAVVVWIQDDAGNASLWSNDYDAADAGGSWGAANTIEDGAGVAASPQVAMNADGDAMVVWTHGINILASSYDGVWSAFDTIETSLDIGSDPQIAVRSTGDAIAVWSQANHIMYNTFDGTNWSALENEFDVGIPAGVGSSPRLVINSGEGVLVAWLHENSADGIVDVWAGGTLFAGVEEIGNDAFDASDLDLAMGPTGAVAAVWIQDGMVFSNMYDGADWRTDEIQMSGPGALGVSSPQVVMDPSGEYFETIWSQVIGAGDSDIMENLYNLSLPLSDFSPFADSSTFASNPQMSIDAAGNRIVVWDDNGNIIASRYDVSSDVWSSIILDNSGDAYTPKIAMSDNGTAMAVWLNGGDVNLMASVFK
ncbi:MAG: Ig-like domain-containing protein [Pseudomonadota bacterium]